MGPRPDHGPVAARRGGELVSSDLECVFEYGKPKQLVAIMVLKNRAEWERFMRFMERYAETNELSFASAAQS